MRSYFQLEKHDTEQNTDRAKRAFSELDDSLHDKSIDWADWDDTYQFMADHNKPFIKSNLVPDSIVQMKLDIILFVDKQGKLFHVFTLKRFPELAAPNAVQLWHDLNLDSAASAVFRAGESFSGVILHPKCPLLVSVRPILNSKGKGTPRGWLVFGRYFDKRQLKSMEEQTQLDVQIYRADAHSVPAKERQILTALSPNKPIQIRYEDSQTILGYTSIMDVKNQLVLLLKIKLPRHIYQQGLATSHYLAKLIILAVIIFTGVVLLVIEFSVLSRISKLAYQVKYIGEIGNAAKRVILHGSDELSSLAGQINGMLLKLEGTTAKLHESREELRRQNDSLESIVIERTQELLHKNFHDTLTGLPNRSQAIARLKQIAEKKEVSGKAVLYIDLDNFKFINDSLGHTSGDELLLAVAERLKKSVSSTELVARLESDEFVIILDDIPSIDLAIQTAEKVLSIMKAGFSLDSGEGISSVSIGIAYTECPEIEPEDLLRDADTAMYHVKTDEKGNYAVFEPGMNDRLTERVEIEVGLRIAIQQNEFCVHYQPLTDLKTGHLSGVEALVRWHHPEKGMISPGRFIHIAEETGMIIPIGYWVLEEACRQTVEWKLAYPNHGSFTTNVNISGIQLQKPDVVTRVQDILLKTGMEASNLKIEITESVMMEDTECAIDTLKQLRALGVKLALDDFGTGYSSMASLSLFPLDTVKIDQSFINRLITHPEAYSVVAAIIGLAQSLNMDITGEGIETPEQVAVLQLLGCDIGQGYFFGKPLDREALEEKMNKEGLSLVHTAAEQDLELIERLLSEFDKIVPEEIRKAA